MRVHYSLVLLCAAVGRHLVYASSIGDACVIAALAGLYGFICFTDSKKEIPINDSVKSELAHLQSSVNALKVAKAFRA